MKFDAKRFERRFQVWLYTVGHSQLLLRSPKTGSLSTRVDVLFKNVAAIQIPTLFDNLTITEATKDETIALHPQLGSWAFEERKVFIINGAGFLGYVVAGAWFWHEDGLEYNDPSHFQVAPTGDIRI